MNAMSLVPLPFFDDWAADEGYILSTTDQSVVDLIAERFRETDGVIIQLGGKSGRLGESIVATGLLEGMLLALEYLGKTGTAVSIVVDEEVAALFDDNLYQRRYWEQITVTPASLQDVPAIIAERASAMAGGSIFVANLHAAHDGMPQVHIQVQDGSNADAERQRTITTLAQLARVGVRSYASRGPRRRYAAFIENLLSLPAGAVDGMEAQPTLRLSEEDEQRRYHDLAREIGLDPQAIQIICFFQSIVVAKCYTRWDDVLALVCHYFAAAHPGRKIDFLLACGPDDQQPPGFERAELERWLAGFTGAKQNARVLTYAPPLRDLAILTRHASLALSNDTGPGHIAGALQVPTVVPYLPGTLYSKQVWASSLWHHGVTLEPSPFRFQEIEAAVLWDKTEVIDAIPPERLAEEITQIVQMLPNL